jgi:hypothetical protein
VTRELGPILKPRPWASAVRALALALIAALGALAVILGAQGVRTVMVVKARAGAGATVAVWGHGLESSEAAAARAEEILKGAGGVTRATLLDPAPDDRVLARALGAPPGQAAEARVLTADAGGPGAAARLDAVLAANAIAGRASDSRLTAAPNLKALVEVVLTAGIALLSLVGFAWASGGDARAELRVNASTVGLLRIGGASDGFISALARARAMRVIYAGAVAGVAAAFLAVAAWARMGRGAPAPGLIETPRPMDLLWAALFLAAAILNGAAAAALVARAESRRAP